MSSQSNDSSNSQVLATFGDLSDQQLEAALSTAATCSQAWRHRTIAERAVVFVKAAAILHDQLEAFARVVTLESGKLLHQARSEITLCAHIIAYYAKTGDRFLATQHAGAVPAGPGPGSGAPGIVFGVEPWNFPYYQLTRFAAPNLMAGNAVLVKHAEGVTQCAHDFECLWLKAGAPAGLYTNLSMSPDQVNRVIEDPRIKGVALSGGVDAGNRTSRRVGMMRSSPICGSIASGMTAGLADDSFEKTIHSAVWEDLPGYFGPRIS